ncbi:MAG: cyclic nucleotide-binding domain-containing protein [Caldilineaceae bacterium]|nr:cyclic nucleotide-binding domain-containing protein [Caldilineaceae bacterium]
MSVEFLRATPLFHDLSETELEEIVSILREESQPGGATIFRSDENCSDLYLIRSGFVRLFDSYGSVLATLGPGSLLGEAEFLRGLAHNTSAVAASDVHLWSLPDPELRQLLQRQNSIGIKLSQNFGEQISQLEDYLVEQLVRTRALGGLPHRVIGPMARSMQPRQLQRGSFLYQTGQQAEALYLLERGALELQPSPTPEEPSPTASLIEPGNLFGVLPLLTNKTYDASAFSVDDCLIWSLPAATFHNLSSQYPHLRRALGRHSRSRLSLIDQTQAVVRLAQTPLFGKLEPTSLHAVAQRLVLQHVPSGESIYRLGDSSDALFLVDDGEVELTAENESGVLQELARVDVGSYFGAMSLLTGEDRRENATAIRNTNLWVLYRSDLEELVRRLPAIREALDQAADQPPATRHEQVTAERLRRFPLLANLDVDELREVARHLKQAHLRPGEQVFRAGAPSDALYFIERGVIRLQLLNGAGSWTRGDGEVFGEKAILSDEPYGQSAFSETEVDLLYVEYPGLEFLKSRLPSVATDLHRILSQPAGSEEIHTGAPPRPSVEPSMEAPPGFAPGRRETTPTDDLPPPAGRPYPDGGGWFSNLSNWGKIRLALVILLLGYLGIVVAPSLLGITF